MEAPHWDAAPQLAQATDLDSEVALVERQREVIAAWWILQAMQRAADHLLEHWRAVHNPWDCDQLWEHVARHSKPADRITSINDTPSIVGSHSSFTRKLEPSNPQID